MTRRISFELNGLRRALPDDEGRTLLWALRTDTGLTGTKYGCGEAICGACTVLVDGVAQRSCSVPLSAVAGKKVTTIEGLAHGGRLHPLQEAFIDHGAFQCGFCTAGMLLTAASFLAATPRPTREQIQGAMESNLCRCGAHNRIVAAIEDAAAKMGGRK